MVALEDLSAWAAAPRYPGAMPPLSPDLVRQTLEGADALISVVEERITKRLDLKNPIDSLGV